MLYLLLKKIISHTTASQCVAKDITGGSDNRLGPYGRMSKVVTCRIKVPCPSYPLGLPNQNAKIIERSLHSAFDMET